ncbi:hypothetical protein DFA_01279 [Cavenderia fasciculata]|uniref:Intimal thickness related receptor IRP domain-containing protein n=1 Tax=Cavenderia fasciculata TaxID=261658 RepID=F4PRW1_CACFS|nr:uncharacterized protein DFA_01279 [Cavenderia fasciculata]EGG21397.1 hypothetical protein DFA_01279 [Cavenderia fasciculata]|eukprot:XP_004359247.1 hypothetical protein DFA_01279 [Cavenderia fasciculata]
MRTSLVIISLLGLLAIIANVSESKVVSGSFSSSSSWAFVNKFCYGSRGQGSWTFTTTTNNPNLTFYLYDDAESSWGSVYKSSKSCEEKINATQFHETIGNGTTTIPFADTQRPHFWYFVAADCNGGSLDFTYDMEWLNYGGTWYQQFSWEEYGLEGLYLVYFFFFVALTAYSLYSAWNLHKTKSFHPIVKLLTISILLQFLSVFILLIHYGAYSHNGIGGKGLQGFGELIDFASQLTFILLLILLAKGWAISRVTIDEKKIILGVMGCLTVLYLIMFIWYKVGKDPASSVYMYDTVPGILLLIARSIAMIWFMWCAYNTYMEETHPAKRQFYVYFGITFFIWFLALPFICIIAASIDPWERFKTVMGFYVTFNFLALAVLSILLSPNRAADYFTISEGYSSSPYESI